MSKDLWIVCKIPRDGYNYKNSDFAKCEICGLYITRFCDRPNYCYVKVEEGSYSKKYAHRSCMKQAGTFKNKRVGSMSSFDVSVGVIVGSIKFLTFVLKNFGYIVYAEFMASFKPDPYLHICQNYRTALGLPMRWHRKYIPYAKVINKEGSMEV